MIECHRCYTKFESEDVKLLHCDDCKQELSQGDVCDVCNEPKFVKIWEPFWHYRVQSMYDGIETLFTNKRAYHLIALALSTYTEIMGGLVTGNLKQKGKSKENYEAFLPYLGIKYVKLNEKLIEKETSLYHAVRSKLVHEFEPRPSYMIVLSEEPLEARIGIEYLGDHLNFHLREYYRDFKKGVGNYKKELEDCKVNDKILEYFLKSTEISLKNKGNEN